MSKDQIEYENKMCVCGHPRRVHNGITGCCYRHNCKCVHFTLVGDKK